jgi:hypothetical protein
LIADPCRARCTRRTSQKHQFQLCHHLHTARPFHSLTPSIASPNVLFYVCLVKESRSGAVSENRIFFQDSEGISSKNYMDPDRLLFLTSLPPPSVSPEIGRSTTSLDITARPVDATDRHLRPTLTQCCSERRPEHRLCPTPRAPTPPLPRAPAPPDAAPSSSRRRSSTACPAIAPLEAPPPHALVLPHRRTGAPLPIRLCAPLLGATCCGRALRLLTCRTTWNGMPALPFSSMPPAR